jgi:hypothetical protein
MGIWFRLACAFPLVWSLTACAALPTGVVVHQTNLSLTSSPIRASDAGPVVINSSERSGVPVSFHEPSMVLTAMPAAAFFGSSTLHLSQNGDGSISVLSDGRPVSLLRGLDPALVNPAVLPFLFPSCDVPVSPVGVSH